MIAEQRRREEEERKAREAAEKAKKKKGNFLDRHLPTVSEGLKATKSGLKKGGGAVLDKAGDGAGKALDAMNAWNEGVLGGGPAAFGDLKIVYDDDGNPVPTRDYSWRSVLEGPRDLFSVDRVRDENQMMRDAGIDVPDNAWDRLRLAGRSVNNSDIPASAKFALGAGFDPLTWAPTAALSGPARVTGLSKLASIPRVGGAIGRTGRVGAALLTGADSAAVNAGVVGGTTLAIEGADRLGLTGVPAAIATMGGGMIGGGVAGGFKRQGPLAVASPKTAPTKRPIVPVSVPEAVRRSGDRWEVTADGRTISFVSLENARDYAASRGLSASPRPMANERMWFHSTRGDHAALDPEFGIGQSIGISQGPGVYLAADPMKSAGRYGDRTFATEFDGTVLDLAAPADVAFWDRVAGRLGVSLPDDDELRAAQKHAFSPNAQGGELGANWHYRDALVAQVEELVSTGAWGTRDVSGRLGRFKRLLNPDDKYSDDIFPWDTGDAAKAVVSNTLGDLGVDATFHPSKVDGEVLVVINGDKLRTVGEIENGRLIEGSPQSWDDVKGATRGAKPEIEWRPTDDGADLFDRNQRVTSVVRQPDGSWLDIIMDKSYRSLEDAQRDYPSPVRPRFREFGNDGGVVEAGQIAPEYAAILGSTAAGAGLGYLADGEEGALIGGGIGLGGSALAMGARHALTSPGNVAGNVPRPGFEPGRPGAQLQPSPRNSAIDRFHIDTQVTDRRGKPLGRVVNVDGNTGLIQVVDKAGNTQTVSANAVYTKADYSVKKTHDKLLAGQRKVIPEQQLMDGWLADSEDAIRHAEALTQSPHLISSRLGKLGRAIDPAAKFSSAAERRVHQLLVASANLVHRGDSVAVAKADQMLKLLDPLMGEGRTAGLRRAGALATTMAGPTAAGIALSELTGRGEFTELGILGSIGATGALSKAQHNGFMHDTPWAKLKPRDPGALRGGILKANSQDRLIDILQYWDGPDGYKLELLPPDQLAKLQAAKDAWDANDVLQLKLVNAALMASGQQPLPFRENHAVLAAYTDKSLRKSGIKKDNISATDVRSTSFRRQQSIEQRRALGDTLREAYDKAPELELQGGLRELLIEQIRQQERIKASALVTHGLIKDGMAERIPSDIEIAAMSPQSAAKARQRIQQLQAQGWQRMPGVDDVYFQPDVIATVKDLLVTSAGSDNAVMNFLDAATNVTRTALFVGDLNAWTLQGAMTALQNPMGAIRNFFPLVGASVFGERFSNHWKLKHMDMVDAAAKRGARSYEHGGLERQIGFQLADQPGFQQLESRAVAFLDVFRVLASDNIAKQEALLKSLSPEAKGGFKRAAGKVLQGDVGHLALDAARLGPTALAGAAVVTGNEIDVPFLNDDMDKLFTLALGVGGGLAADAAISRGGQMAMDSRRVNGRRSDLEVEAGATAGKTANRISGTNNRQLQGISNRQAQIERVLLMRSPALTRNALTMAKLAATDLGPEGAIARIYLIKTAVMLGAGMAFAHALAEGRMPDESDFDPTNPLSPFSPESFGRADMGRAGRLTPSNPLMSLARAFMRNDMAAGESRWHVPDASEVGSGLADWASGRLPDVTGPLTKPLFDKLATGYSDEEGMPGSPGLINRLEQGDVAGVLWDTAKGVLPVSAQSGIDTGVLGETALGQRAGLEGNPNYNYPQERVAGALASWAGLNHSPESLGKELVVRKDEVATEMFGREYDVLNREDQKKVRDVLAEDETYDAAGKTRRELGIEDTGDDSPIGKYFDAQNAVSDDMANKLALAEQRYNQTGDALGFRKRMQELATERRTRMDQVELDLANASADLRGRDETVQEWLDRNMQPEDAAVEGYYRLFDQATDPATGDLDFDDLERLQAEYLDGLPRRYRSYVNRRINGERELSPGQQEYERVKEVTKPYFEARERRFQEFAKNDPVLSQFDSYSKLSAFVDTVAAQNGITNADAVKALSMQAPMLQIVMDLARIDGEMMRLMNPEMDAALAKWYGYSPQNPLGQIDRELGKAQTMGTLSNARESVHSAVSTPRSGFKRRRRFWE